MKKDDNKLNICAKWDGSINHPLLWKLITNYLNENYSTTMNINTSKDAIADDSRPIIEIPKEYSYHNSAYKGNNGNLRCLNFTIQKDDFEIYLDAINHLMHKYDKLLNMRVICEG